PLTSNTGALTSRASWPDWELLATPSDAGSVRVWNVGTRSQIYVRDNLGGRLAFSPDGKRLVLASGDPDSANRTRVEVWPLAGLGAPPGAAPTPPSKAAD